MDFESCHGKILSWEELKGHNNRIRSFREQNYDDARYILVSYGLIEVVVPGLETRKHAPP